MLEKIKISKPLKRLIAGTGITAAVLLGLLFAGMMLINSDMTGRWLENRINSHLNGQLVIGEHRLSLAGQYLDVSGLNLSSSRGRPLISIGRLRVDVSLPRLIDRTLRINSVRLENVTVELETGPDGSLNLMSVLRREEGPQPETRPPEKNFSRLFLPQTVTVASLRLKGLHIINKTAADTVDVRCPAMSFSGKADLRHPSGKITIESGDWQVTAPGRSLRIHTLAARAALQNGRIDPLVVEADSSAGSIKITGRIRQALDNPQADLSMAGRLDLAGVKNLLAFNQPASGQVDLKATLKGNFNDPVLQAGLTSQQAVIGPVSLILDMAGHVAKGVIHLDRLSTRADGIDLIGRGRYAINTGDINAVLEVTAEDIQPAAARTGFKNVSGRLDMTADVSGNITDPAAVLKINAGNFGVPALTLDQISGRADLSDGRLVVQHLDVRRLNSHCRIAGGIQLMNEKTGTFSSDPAVDLTITQGTVNLADFDNDQLKGRVAVRGQINGTIQNPAGNLSLQADHLETPALHVQQVNLDADLAGNIVGITAFTAGFSDGQRVTGSGNLSLEKRAYDFRLESPGISLARIRPIQARGLVDGIARFAVSGRGEWWEIPSLDGSLHLEGLLFAGRAVDDLALDADFNHHRMDVFVRGDPAASGTVDLTDMHFSAQCEMTDTALAPWFALSGRSDLGGRVWGRLKAEGSLADITGMTASADIEQVILSHDRHGDVRTRPFRLHYQEGLLHVPDIHLVVADTETIDVNGRIGIDGAMDMAIKGTVPCAIPAMYIPEILNPEGRLLVNAAVSGTIGSPVVTGGLSLSDVGLQLSGMAHKLHDINGRIALTPAEIRLVDLHGGLGKGRFRISGDAGLEKHLPGDMDIRLQVESLPVSLPDTMDLKLDADLALVKNPRQAIIQGEIILLDGIYYKNAEIAGYTDAILSSFEKKRPRPTAPEDRLPSFITDMALDVKVRHRLPFKVDNNIARLAVQPDINVKGKAGNPILLGEARTVSGEVRFQGTLFQVEKGIISFTNPYKTEPHINITAVTSVKDWEIRLSATGTPEQLEVELASEPYEEQADILSLLFFGKPTRDMNGSSGTSQSPAQILAGFLAGKAADNIKDMTGLDIVEISAQGDSGQEDAARGRITVGSRVTDRLSVKYSIKSGKDGVVQENASEYRLTENSTVSGFQDSRGVFGGRLIYRLEFR